jgi:hypothetical protein
MHLVDYSLSLASQIFNLSAEHLRAGGGGKEYRCDNGRPRADRGKTQNGIACANSSHR